MARRVGRFMVGHRVKRLGAYEGLAGGHVDLVQARYVAGAGAAFADGGRRVLQKALGIGQDLEGRRNRSTGAITRALLKEVGRRAALDTALPTPRLDGLPERPFADHDHARSDPQALSPGRAG